MDVLMGLSIEQIAKVAAFLFALSEVLAQIEPIRANSVFQLIVGVLKRLAGKSE